MNGWLAYASIAIVLWGVVGLFQKLGTNRISSRSLVVWLTAGFLILLPFFWSQGGVSSLSPRIVAMGLFGGLLNGLGSWALFASLEKGAKASVAIPMTALYPLFTVALAVIFLKERPTRLEWIGVMLALAAGAMLSYEPSADTGTRA